MWACFDEGRKLFVIGAWSLALPEQRVRFSVFAVGGVGLGPVGFLSLNAKMREYGGLR
jgi:hypothetical protein